MPTRLLLFVGLPLLLAAPTTQAKIWRVNNNGGINASYASAQAAQDAAITVAGDTRHLEASQANYGSLRATKRLIIIGPGYFLRQNTNT